VINVENEYIINKWWWRMDGCRKNW